MVASAASSDKASTRAWPLRGQAHKPAVRGRGAAQAQVSAPRPERQKPAPLPWCFRSPVSLVVPPALLFSECVFLVPLPWCFRSAVSLVSLSWCFRSACLWFPLPWCFRSPVSWSVFPVKKIEKNWSGKHAVGNRRRLSTAGASGPGSGGEPANPKGRPQACPVGGRVVHGGRGRIGVSLPAT